MEDIYYIEVSGNTVKPFINLNPEKIISKKVDTIEIKGLFLEGNHNSSFELEGMGKQLLLGDDIDIDEDIEDDLLK